MSFPEYLNKYIENEADWKKITDFIYGKVTKIEAQKKDAEEKGLTLVIISGLSGAGKDTIVSGLIERDKRFGWVKTCTTRERRPEETEANDTYIRISEGQFQEALKGGDVIEWVEYAGNHYCSLTSVFENALKNVDLPILRIDPKGSMFYSDMWNKKQWLFDKVNLIYFFVVPPSIEALKERLLKRSGNPAFVQERLDQTLLDLPFINEAEYVVVNETDMLELVVEDIAKFIS